MSDNKNNNEPGSLTTSGLSLDEIRIKIDQIDRQLVALLNNRAGLSVEVGKIKQKNGGPIFRPEREKQVLDKLLATSEGLLPHQHLRIIYHEIFSSSRALQRAQKVAFLGPEGTFSHSAALQYFGHSLYYQHCKTIPDVFRSVASQNCDFGIIPIENSLNGTVGQSVDCFLQHNVQVRAELYSRIRHVLFSRENGLTNIQKVYSHPQALGQCSHWLRINLPHAELVAAPSSAAAAEIAMKEENAAAVGNSTLQELFGLNIIARDIEDFADNWTRFVVISASDAEKSSAAQSSSSEIKNESRSSILFSIKDKCGTLVRILDLLASSGINMSKLESRPHPNERWHYIFLADLDCALDRPEYAQVLNTIQAECQFFKLLGVYARGAYFDANRGE